MKEMLTMISVLKKRMRRTLYHGAKHCFDNLLVLMD